MWGKVSGPNQLKTIQSELIAGAARAGCEQAALTQSTLTAPPEAEPISTVPPRCTMFLCYMGCFAVPYINKLVLSCTLLPSLYCWYCLDCVHLGSCQSFPNPAFSSRLFPINLPIFDALLVV